MRVAGIEIKGHPSLGDLRVDFRNSDGHAAGVIVLAGENGCGKTVLLEAVFAALAPGMLVQSQLPQTTSRLADALYYVIVELENEIPTESLGTLNNTRLHKIKEGWPGFKGIFIEVASRNNLAIPTPAFERTMLDSESLRGTIGFEPARFFRNAYACIMSEAHLTFEVPRIDSIRTSAGSPPPSHMPPQVMFPVRGGVGLAHDVAQLLVDLQAADNNDVARWVEAHPNELVPLSERRKRISRFADAFARMMQHKRLVDIEQSEGEHRVIFEEDGRRTTLAVLSTGEKQIVFRGAFLLRQRENLADSVVLLDEPELSLHPHWQNRVLGFYETILREESGKSAQLIVATHSPFVVHGSPVAKHIVLRRNHCSGDIEVEPEPTYPGVTPTDTAIAAFDLADFLRDAQKHRLIVMTEGSTDRAILQEAWRKLYPDREMPFAIRSAGGAKNIPRLFGLGEGKSGPLLESLFETGIVFVALFDFDQEGHSQWNGTIRCADCDPIPFASSCEVRKHRNAPIWAALLPVPTFRAGYAGPELGRDSKLTIELLFEDRYVRRFLQRTRVAGDGNATRLYAPDSKKGDIADASMSFPQDAFAAFEPIFAVFDDIVNCSR